MRSSTAPDELDVSIGTAEGTDHAYPLCAFWAPRAPGSTLGLMPLRVRVCTIDQIAAGELRAFKVEHATWPVMITQHEGETIAFPGFCPHDMVSLVDYGKLEGDEVTCRVHGYRFDLKTGSCEHAPWLRLRRYKVTQVDNEIWVDLL